MTMRTRLTEMLDLEHPVVLAPMGRVAGGALAAAVSNAGGLGLVGGGTASELSWLRTELDIVTRETLPLVPAATPLSPHAAR